MTTWLVRSTDPGTAAFLRHGIAAVNFYVRCDAAQLTPGQIADVVGSASHEPTAAATRTRYANQLAKFTAIEVGDTVVTVDSSNKSRVHVGIVEGGYRFEPESTIADHPHVIGVRWEQSLDRPHIRDQAGLKAIVTVRELQERPSPRSPEAEIAPATPAVGQQPCPYNRCEDHSDYRYRWPQQLPGSGEALLFVMKNPSCPDSTDNRTFANIATRAASLNASSLDVVNLFARRTGSDPSELNRLVYEHAVGPENDEAIRLAAEAADRIIIGWGGPSGVKWYPRRVSAVLGLIGHRQLWSIEGRSPTNNPLHPQVWSPKYELTEWTQR